MRIYSIQNNLYFGHTHSGNDNGDRTQKAATVVGAGAAGVTAAKTPFSQFSQLSRMNKQVNEAARELKTAKEMVAAGKASRSLIGQFGANLTKYKNSIIRFGQRFTDSKLIKPIIESKFYRGAAGFTGGVVAGCVTLAGIGDITSTLARKADQLTH